MLPPGLAAPPDAWGLAGTDLSHVLASGAVAKQANAAFGQITRCYNCTLAYTGSVATMITGCNNDAQDRGRFAVPCALTPSADFDWMGFSVRTPEWR